MEESNPNRKQERLAVSGMQGAIDRIVVVDRDRGAAERVGRPLRRAGWTIEIADDTARARAALFADRGQIGLALVALRLPNGDATDLCRELLAGGGPPVILVGDPAQEAALIAGLQIGADDYLLEPVKTAELLGRVGAVVRRAFAANAPKAPADQQQHRVGPLTVDPAARLVTWDGEPIQLTPREYALLLMLASRAGTVVTREEIFAAIWGSGWMGSTKVLDVQISGLRHKLAGEGGRPPLIETIRGIGFRLAEPPV